MANVDAPFGLRPVRYLNGAPWNGQANLYWCSAATDTTVMYIGDPVTLSALGSNASAIGEYGPGMLAAVKTAGAGAATVPYLGVVVGFEPILGAGASQQSSTIHRVASTERLVWVADDPMLVFQIQEDNDTNDLAATSVNLNCDLIATAVTAGNAALGISGFELDSSSANTTATLDCQILNLSRIPGNALGDYAVWDVRFNIHQYNMTDATTGSVGI
jgi:hypothetical protein